MVLENNENHLADEIYKVKDRLKTISSALENQQTFLRLIIQVCDVIIFIQFFFSCLICTYAIWFPENGNQNRRRRSR